jgi:hypothetical protein
MAEDLKGKWIERGDFIITTDHWKGSGLSYGLVVKASFGQVEVISYDHSYMRQVRKTDKYILKIPKEQVPKEDLDCLHRNLNALCERQQQNPRHYMMYGLLLRREDFDVQFGRLNINEAS